MIVFDVDHLKAVIDKHGHAVGDRVLIDLAELLTVEAPVVSVVARLGGDEFIVVAGHDEARVDALARELVHGDAVPVTYGTAVGPTDADVLDELLPLADADMYRAKGVASRYLTPRRAAGPRRYR